MPGLRRAQGQAEVKRARRRGDKPAALASLCLTQALDGDSVVLSDDLHQALFRYAQGKTANPSLPGGVSDEMLSRVDSAEGGRQPGVPSLERSHYVAISHTAESDLGPTEGAEWTIVQCQAYSDGESRSLPHKVKTVWCSYGHTALQRIHRGLPRARFAQTAKLAGRIDIRVLDVVPLSLDAVYIEVESPWAGDARRPQVKGLEGSLQHEPGDRKSLDAEEDAEHAPETDGFSTRSVNAEGPPESNAVQPALHSRIRSLLGPLRIVRPGQVFEVPAVSYQVSSMSAKVTYCEPVMQGILGATTLIVLRFKRDAARESQSWASLEASQASGKNDSRRPTQDIYSTIGGHTGFTGSDAAIDHIENSSVRDGAADSCQGSEDSDEDMISLELPPISSQLSVPLAKQRPQSDLTQSLQSGPSTPSTAHSQLEGRLAHTFTVQALTLTIPDAAIHPCPSADDDPDARVFVESRDLIRLGCFSGDWIRLEPVSRTGQELPNGDGPESLDVWQWRATRIYALPDDYIRTVPTKSSDDQANYLAHHVGASKGRLRMAYVSRGLLLNLENPIDVRLSPLLPSLHNSHGLAYPEKNRLPSSGNLPSPPRAKEVTLRKLSTPFSTERPSQALLLVALKQHFEERRRLVRQGDVIGVKMASDLGRLASQARLHAEGTPEILELLEASPAHADEFARTFTGPQDRSVLAWFRVGDLIVDPADLGEECTGVWGGMVLVDPSITRMVQAGNFQGHLPQAAFDHSGTLTTGDASRTQEAGAESNNGGSESRNEEPTSPRQRLKQLMSVAASPAAIDLQLGPLAVLLYSQQRRVGKSTTAVRACADLGLHVFTIDAYDIVSGGAGGGDVQTEGLLRARAERAMSCGSEHCAILVEHVEAFTAERVFTALREILTEARILIATTADIDNVQPGLRALFSHEIQIAVPDERARQQLLQDILASQGMSLAADVELSAVATKTAALVAGDLVDVVDRAIAARTSRLDSLLVRMNNNGYSEVPVTTRDLYLSGGDAVCGLTKSDLDEAVDAARKNFSDAIGAPKIPTVQWEDVGGLSHVKDAVMETIQLPLDHPELFAKGMKKRSGILLYGPPGTGKTLLAKAIATEFSLNFFSVKGPELLNMYIGESEANVRRVFQRARDARPCVVFFDELDSVAPKRGNQGDSGGVMDRIVSQLLAELDGMSDGHAAAAGGVFVVGATNRPDLLDPALLRPGRFDKMLYLGIADTHQKQLKILQALTRKFELDPTLSLERIAGALPLTYSGADIYALCSDAMLKAIARKVAVVEGKVQAMAEARVSTAYYLDRLATEDDVAVVVTEEDFAAAQRELVASVSATELEHYERVRRAFERTDQRPIFAS